jgi:stalled ribosome rescue protein Dom34
MSTHHHAVIWMDRQEARIIFFNSDDSVAQIIKAGHGAGHIHSRGGSSSGTHRHGDTAFFEEIAEALRPARAALLVGPSEAKSEFAAFLGKRYPKVNEAISEIQPAQRMTDPQLLAIGRSFFKAWDRVHAASDLDTNA